MEENEIKKYLYTGDLKTRFNNELRVSYLKKLKEKDKTVKSSASLDEFDPKWVKNNDPDLIIFTQFLIDFETQRYKTFAEFEIPNDTNNKIISNIQDMKCSPYPIGEGMMLDIKNGIINFVVKKAGIKSNNRTATEFDRENLQNFLNEFNKKNKLNIKIEDLIELKLVFKDAFCFVTCGEINTNKKTMHIYTDNFSPYQNSSNNEIDIRFQETIENVFLKINKEISTNESENILSFPLLTNRFGNEKKEGNHHLFFMKKLKYSEDKNHGIPQLDLNVIHDKLPDLIKDYYKRNKSLVGFYKFNVKYDIHSTESAISLDGRDDSSDFDVRGIFYHIDKDAELDHIIYSVPNMTQIDINQKTSKKETRDAFFKFFRKQHSEFTV